MKRIIYWFRNDLRVHDNEGFLKATQQADEVIPVYCFDPRHFAETSLGFTKTGVFRAQFLLESVQDLRRTLRNLDADLVVRTGKPETVLFEMAQMLDATAIYTSKEVTQEETQIEADLTKNLKTKNVDFEQFWSSTLYHPKDLPFWFSKLPDVFTDFRKAVERSSKVRPTFEDPTEILYPTGVEAGRMPAINDLIPLATVPEIDPRGVLPFKGGETEALKRLQAYIWEHDQLKVYKETRNQMLGADYSSKFSVWLSLGCLSPRRVYEEVKRYENERVSNDSTYWLVFELIWRDYFRFVALKFGTRIFKTPGIKNDLVTKWVRNVPLFQKWIDGTTGVPLVDANMRELKETGFMSNRGRQNVASFLAKDLGIDWTWGAAWFESQLLDYDVCSNWGNWNYVAGVGNDPRENRYFNIHFQATRYDADGSYVKHWLPELEGVPAKQVHQVWTLSRADQQRFGAILGADYPMPIINANKWLK